MRRLFPIIIIVWAVACKPVQTPKESKVMDFGSFTIEAPESWKKIEKKGADSYVGGIAMDSKDTLSFDLGWYSNDLYEYDQLVLDSNMLESIDTNFVDPNSVIFVKSKRRVDLDRYRLNNVSWDTIDGRLAKIIYPRRSGTGITGIYIDTLYLRNADVDKFNLYGTNLQPENEKKLLSALQTLKFRQ